MAKKKSNTGMIIAIIVSVIVVGIVVWGFLTKWKFIDDGKSTKKAKAKAKAKAEAKKQVQEKIETILSIPTDTKVVKNSPKTEEKLKKVKQKNEEKIKRMSDEEIKQEMLKVKKDTEKQLDGFRIIEHMSQEETSDDDPSFDFLPKCEFSDTEIETVITKALNFFNLYTGSNVNVATAIPKLVQYFVLTCRAESVGITIPLAGVCKTMLGYEFNPRTLGLYGLLDFIKPPEGGTAGKLYSLRYFLFKTDDKQTVTWSNEPESKEIRILYKLYKVLKACPVVQAPPGQAGSCDDSSYTAKDSYGDGCPEYRQTPEWCRKFDSDTFQSSNCCVCKK